MTKDGVINEDLMHFKKLLKNNGYEFTSQKQIILRTIMNYETHLNAKEIYGKVREKNIGLATIYRALKVFNELGIVKEINIDGISYYEMEIFSGKPLHIHFKCCKCNSIIDLDSKTLNLDYLKLNKKMEKEKNLEIYDSNIIFVGLCSNCKEEVKCRR